MGGMGRGDGLSWRVPGLRQADGTWEIAAVQARIDQLAQRRDDLIPRFAQLAERLAEARERLASGLPPEPLLDNELAATRDTFDRLYADVRALADLLDIALPQPVGALTLPEIATALDALSAGLDAERDRQARLAAERRDVALVIIDRIAAITYRGPVGAEGFAPLRTCQKRASDLREAICDVAPPDLHPDVAALVEGAHPFNHLLDLINGLPTLDEPDYRRLLNTVVADFDEPLARAAGRGLLLTGELQSAIAHTNDEEQQ